MTSSRTIHPGTAFSAALVALLLGALYYGAFSWLVRVDWLREDYSASALVPLIAGYLVYERRAALSAADASPSWYGLLPVLAGLALFWLGELAGEFFTLYLSFWLVLVGLIWCWMGSRRLLALRFPLFILLAMFPLPSYLSDLVTLRLKLISSWLGVWVMRLYGLSAYREGNIIDLGFTRLQVVDACSGLRYFVPLLVLAILLAGYYRAPFWKRLLFVLSAIPVSVLTNGMRIASVGILYQFFGPVVAEGFFHDFSGWFIFMFSLALLLLELKLWKRLFPDGAPQQVEPAARRDTPRQVPGKLSPVPAQLVLPLLLIIATLVASSSVDFRQRVVPARSFSDFPLEIAGWQGSRVALEQAALDRLDLDQYAMVDYRDSRGRMVNFYTAYYGSQSKGESIHSPASCLPGSGWSFEESGAVPVPLAQAGGTMRVNRACMQRGGSKELTYYWFPQRGRVLTSAWQLKLYTFWDALTRRRTDGALVRLITPVYETERLSDAEARLQGFTRAIVPVLARFIPQ